MTPDKSKSAQQYEIRPDVLNYDDIAAMAPAVKGHEKLVNALLHLFSVDKVNALHRHNCDTPGVDFTTGLLKELNIKLRVDNAEVLDNMPDGAFITVSNHPFGALDGIALINLVGSRYPDYKVMVNMILNHITAMRPNFIAVDALASDDPAKKAVSMQGIRMAIRQVRSGNPLGFFPAGAVSKINGRFQLEDRDWQPTVVRLIQQLKVPVVPIFFHGSNSWWFNFLGRVSWQLRTLRLPAEVFRKRNHTLHISVGNPISVADQLSHQGSEEEFGAFLKSMTYSLRSWK
ncbi:MAG: lysophospholipid acyltransferase family protein [Paramuribaculum sp.]|nr:lysophospholipid acyltransferase family protein [Paramuribaculum sp.]